MPEFSLQVLGYGAAYPTPERLTTSFLVKADNQSYLIDCGEGAQLQFTKYSIKRKNLKAICITHLHGDHCFGLLGIISSLTHFQRKEELILIGPTALREYVETTIRLCQIRLSYSLKFICLEEGSQGKIYEDNAVEIHTFPLKHRIQTQGYRLYETKQPPKLTKSAIHDLKLTVEEIKSIKASQPVLRAGTMLELSQYVTHIAQRSISICTDTIYDEEIIPHIENSDLCYHEATYTKDLSTQARERKHATAEEAAKIAKLAKVSRLLIGHFSSRYSDYTSLLEEAQLIFPETILCREGLEIKL